MACCLSAGSACNDSPSHSPVDPTLVDEGRELYAAFHPTTGGTGYSCAECHGTDGSGGSAPSIRGEAGDHLQNHAQAGGGHPEGILFPELAQDDFVAIASFLGSEDAGEHNDNEEPVETLPGDAVRGEELFITPRETADSGRFSCANCHAADGSSGFGPIIRNEPADHLQAHAQGGGRHPAGVKYPDFTAQDFADMAAYLADDSEHHDDDVHGARQ